LATGEFTLTRRGVRLAGLDFGGRGASILLLHGLAGYAGEWRDTAGWLCEQARVVALDGRGHGASDRRPADVSLSAHAADAAHAIERLNLGRSVVVGQSIGGQTAILLAATRPELVRGLVVVDADPEGADARTVEGVEAWLRAWPEPFASRRDAVEFFGGTPERAAAWAEGLEERDGGLRPRFEVDVVIRTLTDTVGRSLWGEWESISAPTLIVRAENGDVAPQTAAAMVERLSQAGLVEVPAAGHDLHLDRPHEWRAILSAFLGQLVGAPGFDSRSNG
jgi:pimeloyl-ACP methyl ester carboxylesterase